MLVVKKLDPESFIYLTSDWIQLYYPATKCFVVDETKQPPNHRWAKNLFDVKFVMVEYGFRHILCTFINNFTCNIQNQNDNHAHVVRHLRCILDCFMCRGSKFYIIMIHNFMACAKLASLLWHLYPLKKKIWYCGWILPRSKELEHVHYW